MDIGYCTLAIHEPYRSMARRLCMDLMPLPTVVLTDKPEDFKDLPVKAVEHKPTGPMAEDYRRHPELKPASARAAYHDKRFAVQLTLKDFRTAIFLDADSRVTRRPELGKFMPGLGVLPKTQRSIKQHLERFGSVRRPIFEELSQLITGTADLSSAWWCYESCYSVTKDGREAQFFWAWERAATFLQKRGVYSGEGGVLGIAANYACWPVDLRVLRPIVPLLQHDAVGVGKP